MASSRQPAATQARAVKAAQAAMLAAILVLAAVLRLWRLDAISFTYDAAAIANLAAHMVDTGQAPLQGMMSSTGLRNPALGVILIGFPVLFSRDPVVLAGFVALLNVAGVYGTYWLGRRYWSTGVGLVAALLFAVSPWAVQHSRGILGQDLLIPGVVLFFAFLYLWMVDGKNWALAAAIVTLMALVQIHFAALAFLPLLAILVLWQIFGCLRRHQRVPFWKPLILGAVLGGLLYIPYVIAEAQNGWEIVRQVRDLAEQPYRLFRQTPDLALMTVSGRNIHSLAGPRTYQAYMAGLIDHGYRLDRLEEWLVVLAVATIAVRWVQRRKDQRLARRDGLLLLWLIGPLVFFTVSKSEVYPHYLVVIYSAPFLALAAAGQDILASLKNRPWLRKGMSALGTVTIAAIVVWQAYLLVSIYRFIDLTDTPEGWGTPVRILRDVAHTAQQLAALNEPTEVVMLCSGSEPRWDECPAVFSFLTSRGPKMRFIDTNDPTFRTLQDDTETLVILAPGDSLAAAELPHLAQALPDADVPLRENQGAYRFFRIHNPYQDIASTIDAVAQPDDAIVLVGPGQREDLARFYKGPLRIVELPQQPVDRDATIRHLEQLAGEHRRLYAVYRASEVNDPQGIVNGWLSTHTAATADQWLRNVRVVTNAAPHSTGDWPVQDTSAGFDGQIQLRQVARSAESVRAGDMLVLRTDWQALVQPKADYSLFVQLLDQDGKVQVQRDLPLVDSDPSSQAFQATSVWQAGQAVTSLVGLGIPAGTPPGPYRLILGLYGPADGKRLPTGETDHIDLGTVTVERPNDAGALGISGMRYRPNAAFSEVTLVSHDRYTSGFAHAPDTHLHPGEALTLVFDWRADGQPGQDWMVKTRLVNDRDQTVATMNAPLVSERYPTSQWMAGEIVRGEHDLPVPAALAPGRYQLQLAVYPSHRADQPSDWAGLGPVLVSQPDGQ